MVVLLSGARMIFTVAVLILRAACLEVDSNTSFQKELATFPIKDRSEVILKDEAVGIRLSVLVTLEAQQLSSL